MRPVLPGAPAPGAAGPPRRRSCSWQQEAVRGPDVAGTPAALRRLSRAAPAGTVSKRAARRRSGPSPPDHRGRRGLAAAPRRASKPSGYGAGPLPCRGVAVAESPAWSAYQVWYSSARRLFTLAHTGRLQSCGAGRSRGRSPCDRACWPRRARACRDADASAPGAIRLTTAFALS